MGKNLNFIGEMLIAQVIILFEKNAQPGGRTIPALGRKGSKNPDARRVYLDGELKENFAQLWAGRKKSRKILPYVFPNKNGTDRIKRFDKSWKNACKDAGVGKRLFHDLRRTAVRNMVRSGIPETVAMMISGHKTRSVFDRYNITNDADLIAAAKKQEVYLKCFTGTISGTIHQIDKKRVNTDEC